MLDRGQLEEFGERGFLVLRRAVPPVLVAAASAAIDELVEREPPGADVRGPHNYFPEAARAPALAALLTGSPAGLRRPPRPAREYHAPLITLHDRR